MQGVDIDRAVARLTDGLTEQAIERLGHNIGRQLRYLDRRWDFSPFWGNAVLTLALIVDSTDELGILRKDFPTDSKKGTVDRNRTRNLSD